MADKSSQGLETHTAFAVGTVVELFVVWGPQQAHTSATSSSTWNDFGPQVEGRIPRTDGRVEVLVQPIKGLEGAVAEVALVSLPIP